MYLSPNTNSFLSSNNSLPNFGIDTKNMVDSLKLLLSMEYTLYVKTQNYHWNITGFSFSSLHKLLSKQYLTSSTFIDRIAEQIRKYGYPSPGSMYEFLSLQQNIVEAPGLILDQNVAINDLMMSNETIIRYINELNVYEMDLATQNLLGEILDVHMKNSWMLRSHLI